MALGDDFPDVLAAARGGDEWAWTRLYTDLSPTIVGYLVAQRAPHAEDVASEVFLQMVRDLPRFAGDEVNFRSWVFTITHHRLIDARRRVSRRPAEPTPDETLDRRLPAVEIESQVLESVTTDELSLLFDEVTRDQRAVLLLRIVGGLTLPEVADVLGKQHESVRALQKRGLSRLRAVMADPAYPHVTRAALTRVV